MNRAQLLLSRVRALTLLIIAGLVISGATAIPLTSELNLLRGFFPKTESISENSLPGWVDRVAVAVSDTDAKFPFMAYGTDWLAFGHFVIAIVFIGAWRDPVRNAWLFDFGLIASVLVIPYALTFGALRGIPLYWRLIDCSFGVGCVIPLWFCKQYARELSCLAKNTSSLR